MCNVYIICNVQFVMYNVPYIMGNGQWAILWTGYLEHTIILFKMTLWQVVYIQLSAVSVKTDQNCNYIPVPYLWYMYNCGEVWKYV